jgi:hypothetical protein
VKTLTRLKDYIAHSKLGVKPLCLGEAIAADTWVLTKPMLEAIAKAKADPKQAWSLDERGYPYWVPGFFDANQAWLKRMEKVCGGPVDELALVDDSFMYAFLMRQYQIETYRKMIPFGGYVVSVIRDFPLAAMGLIDYTEVPKGYSYEQRNLKIFDQALRFNWMWHRDAWIYPATKSDRRGFAASEEVQINWLTCDISGQIKEKVGWKKPSVHYLDRADKEDFRGGIPPEIAEAPPREIKTYATQKITLPADVNRPEQFNAFSSISLEPLKERKNADDLLKLEVLDLLDGWIVPKDKQLSKSSVPITIVSSLSNDVLDKLEKGDLVLLLPNGKQGSLPLQSHWFLRGGPFVNRNHNLIKSIPKLGDLFVHLQHFDLAADVIPDVNYLEEIDPILMLWDNHDLKEVRTHGLVFETRVGKGRLLVSALNHQGETNAAGKYLLDVFLKHLESGPPPRNALKPETIARMRAKLNEKRLDLVAKSWQFMPDGKEEGLKLGWHQPGFDDKAWKPIKIGKHWEAQGYPDLDGWAWYRLKVEIPKDWAAVPIYLNSEGVDDAYEIYFNGTKIGAGGDIPNKKTAFEERKAHAIPAHLLKPGESNLIAIRVYDWYGSGGIHRPMTLSNMPIGGVDILK